MSAGEKLDNVAELVGGLHTHESNNSRDNREQNSIPGYKIESDDPKHGEEIDEEVEELDRILSCLLYTSPSPRDLSTSRMPSSA